MDDDFDPYEPYIPDGHVLCPRCDGHQVVNCYCGGDLCVCDNYGEEPCPFCGGEYGGDGYVPKDEKYERYVKAQAEMVAAFHAAFQDANQK